MSARGSRGQVRSNDNLGLAQSASLLDPPSMVECPCSLKDVLLRAKMSHLVERGNLALVHLGCIQDVTQMGTDGFSKTQFPILRPRVRTKL